MITLPLSLTQIFHFNMLASIHSKTICLEHFMTKMIIKDLRITLTRIHDNSKEKVEKETKRVQLVDMVRLSSHPYVAKHNSKHSSSKAADE